MKAQRILVMGLPGAGKTYLTSHIVTELKNRNKLVKWLNADTIREQYNDWDFSTEGRIRQSKRMRDLADLSTDIDFVICDFVAPLIEMRDIFDATYVIWVDTINTSQFADTNSMFIPPQNYTFRVTEQDSKKWSKIIVDDIVL